MLRGGREVHTGAFIARIEDALRKASIYQDDLAQALAASLMPLDRLEGEAGAAVALSMEMEEDPPLVREEALLRGLLAWFKSEFFTWTDRPVCGYCDGKDTTRLARTAAPNPREAAHLASVVEVYTCSACGAETRFPRYNDPLKLLETRRGRCGEWANAFALCCAAAGLRARQALDWTDHVWAEVFLPLRAGEAPGRWVHADPCEAAMDTPLLYEAGWGKRLSYVIAVDENGVVDVSCRYARDWEAMKARRVLVDADWLKEYLAHTTAQLRSHLSADQLAELAARDAADAARDPNPVPTRQRLPGRQSGSETWVASRGEGGGDKAGAADEGPAAAGPPLVRYRLAGDEGVAARLPGRLTGGAVRASGQNGEAEAAVRALDGDPATKWLDFGGGAPGAVPWLEYRVRGGAGKAGVEVARYVLTAGNDAPARDPKAVALEGQRPGSSEWVTLDEREGLCFPERGSALSFDLPTESCFPCVAFRLRILELLDRAAAGAVQLACWDLYVAR
ncbi:hypothetical protein ACKKBF_B20210 [Auxenochlorella protothecoides x Auxenochlorella symbiontica]